MVALIILQPEMALKVLRGHISGSEYGFMRPSRRKPSYSLNFNFTETAWKTGIQEPALLLDRAKEYRNPQDSSQSLGIIAIARVIGRMRNSDGSRPIEVSDWTILPRGIALHEVTCHMDPARSGLLWSSFDDITRPLSSRLDGELRDVLVNIIPNYDQIVRSKRQKSHRGADRANTGQAMLDAERRDRFGTSLRMFGIADWASAEAVSSRTRIPDRVERFEFNLTEQDMLTDDSSVVPGWLPAGRSVGGWFEFYDKGRRLLVKNINFQRAESESGGDIIYVRDCPPTILLVQYKRLTTRKGTLLYDSADRLYRQLGKLVSLQDEDDAAKGNDALTEDSYRLSEISGFVKFVLTRPLKPGDDDLLPGYYLPAPYYHKLLQAKADSGELGGAAQFMPDRYIDSQTFIRLVSGGWIGSRSDASHELARKLGAILRESNAGEVTLAMEVDDSQ